MIKESKFYEKVNEDVICKVCERNCRIPPDSTGFCKNRKNIDGKLYLMTYGLLSAIESRPIEIKPFFHYFPGTTALTFSGYGCNFRCPWCQNFHLSQADVPEEHNEISPKEVINIALKNRDKGLCGSFNEPTIHLEYFSEIFELGRKNGLYNCIVTNGYMSKEALRVFIESGVNGFSIDVKGCPQTYKKYLKADVKKVLRNIKLILQEGLHVEVVFLVVTKANDELECIRWVIKNISNISQDIPLHINRYYPAYKYFEKETDIGKLNTAREIAKELGMKFIYLGNIGTNENTYCPNCGTSVIERNWYRVRIKLRGNRCPTCNYKIPGLFDIKTKVENV